MAGNAVVDVHAHFVPQAALEELPCGFRARWSEDRATVRVEDAGGRSGRPTARVLCDLERLVERRDAHGVDVSIVAPWVDAMVATAEAGAQRDLCRHFSRELGRAVEAIPGVEWLAAIPDADGEMAADELVTALGDGAVGGVISSAFASGGLGRDDLSTLWAAAEQAGRPVVVHPGVYDPATVPVAGDVLIPLFYPFLTTRAAGELLRAGVPDRYPDLKVVLPHGGGFLPYQYGRLRHFNATQSKPVTADMKWFFYDSVLHSGAALQFLVDSVGADRVMAGSDCPFAMADWAPFGDEGSLPTNASAPMLGETALAVFSLERP